MTSADMKELETLISEIEKFLEEEYDE